MPGTASRARTPEIRKGDTVIVLSGKDAGKRGTVARVYAEGRSAMRGWGMKPNPIRAARGSFVVVDGVNIAKRHTKPRPVANSTDRTPTVQQGGILDIPQPLAIGKVMLVCPRCDKPTRVRHATGGDGRSVRICRHCGEQMEVRA
jgi:large subunit ribosomal protein L24